MGTIDPQDRSYLGVNRNVFIIGWVSFLTDVSSEMIFNILPIFLLNVLGVGTTFIGVIEGLGDSAATVLRVASGWISDRLGRRKGLAIAGYALSTIAKPFLIIASSGGAVLGIRLTERLGKGLRSAPRDALIADSSTGATMGRSFGFHKMLDTLGAFVGIFVAAIVIYVIIGSEAALTESTFDWLVIMAIIPAVLSVLLLAFFVREARSCSTGVDGADGGPVRRGFDARFKIFLAVMALFTLGNSTTAFLVLRADNIGISPFYILLLLAMFNLVYALISYPMGRLSDRLGRKRILVAGWGLYALTYIGFALAHTWWHVMLLFGLYGVYYGMTDGVTKAFVADIVPQERRGTAYGLYHGVVGLLLLPASAIAGYLWSLTPSDPVWPFVFGAAMSGLAMAGMAFFVKELRIQAK